MEAIPGTISYYGVEPRQASYTLLDLFSGAGGLSLGLSWAGFGSVGGVEVDSDAAATYELNFGQHLERDAGGNLLSAEQSDLRRFKGKIDLLVGGPPCQGFSRLGRGEPDDPRNRLWREFMRAVELVQPRAFLMENVPEILKSDEGRSTLETAGRLGYATDHGVLNAERFGVPQRRRRAFILGVQGGVASLPEPPTNLDVRTVQWALAGLPDCPDGENWHIGRNPTETSLERYRVVPEGGNRFDLIKARPDITPPCWLKKKSGSTDVFGRLRRDQPALTIRTEFFKPEKGRYLHPSADRAITHREAARLQTFPDDFAFVGTRLQVAKQIGNAVPPLLAYHLGNAIRESWEHVPTGATRPVRGHVAPD